jgi:hypothetical protein
MPGERCSKRFSQPLSETTHATPNSYYQWVVPYYAPTLLLWQAYCCFMYITSKSFAHYITNTLQNLNQ